MFPSNPVSDIPYMDWYELQTSPQQYGGTGASVPNTAVQSAIHGTDYVTPETSHNESSLISTGVRFIHSAGQPTNVMSTSFTGPQLETQDRVRKCVMDFCEFRSDDQQVHKNHMRDVHSEAFTCDECRYVGRSQLEVAMHASHMGHASFVCKHDGCAKKFSRLDTYQRHQRTHREDAKRFLCKYCRKYRGSKGFKRKDHLTQHIRNYHHIGEDDQNRHVYNRKWCPKKECTEPIPVGVDPWNSGVFSSSKEWVKHMRTVHDESNFPCPQPGCDRINGKGYFRPADLRAHLRKVHGADGSFDLNIQNDLGLAW